jgi:type VI secretion system secreted protein VgrG
MAMIEELLQQIVERLDSRYFGKYRGYVSDVTDPLHLGRLKARVPRLFGTAETGWAMPCTPYAGPDRGLYAVPEPGAGVWIEFEGGDPSRPIWSGTWWGKPGTSDIDQPDSTAREAPAESEIPKEHYPERLVDPDVKMFKSAAGHYILFDDRPETARVEIRDNVGNRLILSKDGIQMLANTDAGVTEGDRSREVDGADSLRVGGGQVRDIKGNVERDVDGDVRNDVTGTLRESYQAAGYKRTLDHEGMQETIGGPVKQTVRGGVKRTVSGAVDDVAVGGYGVSSGGNVSVTAGKSLKLAAVMPDMPGPSINAVSIDALFGNVSINTMLGMGKFGGMSAVSPMVLGDGLALHFLMLAQILKAVNPLTVAAYGPALDVWAAMTPLMDWSYFGYVKRFPFGP